MNDQVWFKQFYKSKEYKFLQKRPLAYFCIEYSLKDTLPTYAGGLGVLAGDYVRELADQKIPAVAVGLYYHSRYGSDLQQVRKNTFSPPEQELAPVLNSDNKPLRIQIPIQDRKVYLKVWLWQKGSIPVYLLDPDIEENARADRLIGYKLYDSNKETRLKQEMILGIGGFRLLEALRIEPSIYHMNEGHSALLNLEIIRHEMQKRKIGFHEAQSLATKHVVFTNHTLLAAGDEVYSNELFSYLLAGYASEIEVPLSELTALGTIQDSNNFSLSLFAFRLAGKINGVSELHAKKAALTWTDFVIEAVTNGIHVPTWDKVGDTALPVAKKKNKKELLRLIEQKTGNVWKENELLIGWARRVVRYKRPLAFFGEIKRLKEIAQNAKMPVRIVVSGITHQGDEEGRELLASLQELIKKELPGSAVYLPDYNITLAKFLISGCDVWLNTPVVGSEACGTSGMKAGLNGVLPCTTKDGWVDEVDLSNSGWIIESDKIHTSLLDILEEKIIPMYYSTDTISWEKHMENTRALIKNQFNTTRMLKDYFEKLYLPIVTTSYAHYFS